MRESWRGKERLGKGDAIFKDCHELFTTLRNTFPGKVAMTASIRSALLYAKRMMIIGIIQVIRDTKPNYPTPLRMNRIGTRTIILVNRLPVKQGGIP